MSQINLEEIEKSISEVTEGPWGCVLDSLGGETLYACVYKENIGEGLILAVDTGHATQAEAESTQEFKNARFVSTAADTIKALVAEVRLLRSHTPQTVEPDDVAVIRKERSAYLTDLRRVKAESEEMRKKMLFISSALSDALAELTELKSKTT